MKISAVKRVLMATVALVLVVSLSFGTMLSVSGATVRAMPEAEQKAVGVIVKGDMNGDELVTIIDAVQLYYHVNGKTFLADASGADLNKDDKVNIVDAVKLYYYVNGKTSEDEWNPPTQTECRHSSMKSVAAKDATCTEDGNTAYWYCSECDQYFDNENGYETITLAQTIITASGHTPVVDEGKPATKTEAGLTDGSHCGVCDEVLVPQEVIPILMGYQISYEVANSVSYIETYLLSNTIDIPADKYHYSSEKGIELPVIKIPGYKFIGWSESRSNPNNILTRIAAGETGEKTLYAHWEIETYNIQYDIGFTNIDPDLIEINEKFTTYKVDESKLLPQPKLDGYIFVGWSDENGDVFEKLPVGTSGHKIFTANWISERNMAYTKKQLDAPLVYEDDNVILYTYEIGEIRNVPLYTLVDFGKINTTGVPVTKDYETEKSTSKEMMESYTDYISKATTESFGWTLSDEWSHSTSMDKEWAQSQSVEEERLKEICSNTSSNWYISSGLSGTDTIETVDSTDTYDLKTTTHNEKKYNEQGKETRQDFSAELSTKNSLQMGLSGKLGANVGAEDEALGLNAGLSGELGANINAEKEVGTNLKYSNGVTSTSKVGSEIEDGVTDQEGTISHEGETITHSGSWNTDVGISGSQSVTNTDSVRKAVSQQISQAYGYGESYIESENKTQNQDFAVANTSSKEYTSAVTYGTVETEKTKETYSTVNTISGYHRKVMAGTAHVFAIVGYDIANAAYFVNSFTVMDDEQHMFDDYSCEYASYDDHQNSIIEFKAPDDITKYVATRVMGSNGLEVSKAGEITAYNGTDTFVVIPEYATITNMDGSTSAVKVTSISETAFAKRDAEGNIVRDENGNPLPNDKIQFVEMSDFVTEIPSNTFKGCTSLLSFEADGVIRIGDNAFAGCTSLKACTLGVTVTELGDNVFDGIEHFAVAATSKKLVEQTVKSGAKNITVGISEKCTDLEDVTLTVPSGTVTFTMHGYDRELNDVYIVSNADKTVITRITLNAAGKAPLQITSPEILLQEVTVNSTGLCLISAADSAVISLYGESYIDSAKGQAILCKTVDLKKIGMDYYSQLHTDGDVLVCDEVVDFDNGYLTQQSGTIIPITADEFAKYYQGVINIAFDAAGGNVSLTSKEVYYGETVGELPFPTRDYYTFDGWYTADGTIITEDAVVTEANDITLVAHWIHNIPSDWVLATEVPENAEIVNEKWTYTLTTIEESTSTSLSGYTQVGSYWTETGRGSSNYASFPDGFDTSNWIYTSFNKEAYVGYENMTTMRVVTNSWGGYVYWHWMYDCNSAGAGNRAIYNRYAYGPTNGYMYKFFGAFTSSDAYTATTGYCNNLGATVYKNTGRTSYADSQGSHFWFRFDYYTSNYVDYQKVFQYQKVENKESSTPVSATNSISNVQKWVQYRAK